jgi:hypothetical protein
MTVKELIDALGECPGYIDVVIAYTDEWKAVVKRIRRASIWGARKPRQKPRPRAIGAACAYKVVVPMCPKTSALLGS